MSIIKTPRQRNILLWVSLVLVSVVVVVMVRTQGVKEPEASPLVQTTSRVVPQPHSASNNATSGESGLVNNQGAALLSMRAEARLRVEQIRAAQEQLRAGANPDEVKEPVK